jgi:hypothetical protein
LTAGSESTPKEPIDWEDKNQIKEYFKTKNIFSITVEGEKLVIVYNDKSQQVREVDNYQLLQIKAAVQNWPNQQLSFSELQGENATNSFPQANNNKLYYGIAIGTISGIVLVVLALIFVSRKKTSKKN